MRYNYAYLHGFASSPESKKGLELDRILADHGVNLHRPDLNHPSFQEITYTGMLEAIDGMVDRVDNDRPWRFIGSSMGGFAAARWAELHPEQVDSLLLLCPGFDMQSRWPKLLGDDGMEEWEEEGSFLFFDAKDSLQPVHYELFADADERHPSYPMPQCPALLIHGTEDRIVPIESSRSFVEEHGRSKLVEVDDNHKLYDSLPRIARLALEFFDETVAAAS
jgi:hypothetical protein